MPLVFDMNDPARRGPGLREAAAALRRGALVGMPTETVYGLAADASSGAAVAAIYAAKGRPRFNPLIVHVPSLAAAQELAVFDAAATALAGAFWPGSLTLVLPRRPEAAIADIATAGLPTVALRLPAHPVTRALLEEAGVPVAAPSANRSGHVSATLAAHVLDDLGDALAVLLDAGPSPLGLESTIVAPGPSGVVLLRPGAVPRQAIAAVLGGPLGGLPAEDAAAPVSPGMLASHYAPSVPLRLGSDAVRPGESLLAFGPDLPPGAAKAVAIENLSPAGDVTEAAIRLFAALRNLDSAGAPIAAMPIPAEGLGEAINDRLRRAAAPRS